MELKTMTSETTVATTMPTSSVDVNVAQVTSHSSTVQLTEDIITKVINVPESAHQDNVSATHVVNLTSNMDMSTTPYPGMSTFMTPSVEAYQPSFQRLGGSGVPRPQFPTPDIAQNVLSASPGSGANFTNVSFISEQWFKVQVENTNNEKALENQMILNFLHKGYKPQSVKDIVQRIDYIVHATLSKHVITRQLQCRFPLSMIVRVVGGCTKWIESLNVERWLNLKLHDDIEAGLLKLDIYNDHTVKIVNIPEQKFDLVGLRVLYDFCGCANHMELRYMATDVPYNKNDDFKPTKSFKTYLAQTKCESKVN